MSGAEVVRQALEALESRDWDRFASLLHRDVVHRTPGVPDPILGREAFLHVSRESVRRMPDVSYRLDRMVSEGDTVVTIGEWCYTGPAGPIRQPSVSVIEVRDGLIVSDEEYLGLSF